ncbi:MAG: radical SAM protein [Anaerolineales bacterium]
MFTYLRNSIKLKRGASTLLPRLAVYYVTMQCNLNCTYCEDFGSRRNHLVTPNPTLENAKKILKVIRSGVDHLWLTGGEPLMVPHLLPLLEYARKDLKFRGISLITNGTLLNNVIARSDSDEAIPIKREIASGGRSPPSQRHVVISRSSYHQP